MVVFKIELHNAFSAHLATESDRLFFLKLHLSDAYCVLVAFHHFILSLSSQALGDENVLWPILLQSGGFTSDLVLLGLLVLLFW